MAVKKVYISADIEGVCGLTDWDETEVGLGRFEEFRTQMTREVVAACEGAFEAGAEEVLVRDAHDSARNLVATDLPSSIKLIRGWGGHPYMMMQELDSSYDAALMIGYHAPGGSDGSPLAHTMTNTKAHSLFINGRRASEMYINYLIACLENVPVSFVSGDLAICKEATETIASVSAVAVKEGIGASTISLHPLEAASQIKEAVKTSLLPDNLPEAGTVPDHFDVAIHYVNGELAYKASFYPGAELTEPTVVRFRSDDFFDVLRFYLFNL